MDIIVNWDSSVAAAPAGFRTGINNVVALFDALFTNTATITINVGYGEVGGTSLAATDVGSSISNLAPFLVNTNLGAVIMTNAQYKAIGQTSTTAVDGYVGFASTGIIDFSNSATVAPGTYDFIGIAEHEISEVLGRISSIANTGLPSQLDNLRYAAPGTIAAATASKAYFSLDHGTTDLGDFNTIGGGDLGDWASTGSLAIDAFAAFGTPGTDQTMSATDILLMNAIGYSYNQAIANAVILHDPALNNAIVGSGTNVAGLGGADLFVLNATKQLGFTEFAVTGAALAANWLSWKSDGTPSPEGNALVLDPASKVTAAAMNALGYGGHDVAVTTSTGDTGIYEITAAGVIHAGGRVLFIGSGDTVNAIAGTAITMQSGNGNNVMMSGGTLTIDKGTTATNLIGANNTVGLGTGTYLGLIGGSGNVIGNAIAGSLVNLTSGASAIIQGSGGSVGICGTGIGIVASGENIATIDGATFNLIGAYNGIALGTGAYLGLIGGIGNVVTTGGGGNLINLTSGASVTVQGSASVIGRSAIGICGTAIAVTASGQFINTIPNASFSLTGQDNVIGLATGGIISLLGGNAGYETIFSAGGTVFAEANANLNLAGGDTTIVLGSAGGSTLGLLGGSGWMVSAGNAAIHALAGTALKLNVQGGADLVTVGVDSRLDLIGGPGTLAFITGSRDSLSIVANAGTQTVSGFNAANGDRIDLGGLLAGLPSSTAAMADFVTVSATPDGASITVHGAIGVDTIRLTGGVGLDLPTLMANNGLILPLNA